MRLEFLNRKFKMWSLDIKEACSCFEYILTKNSSAILRLGDRGRGGVKPSGDGMPTGGEGGRIF